MESAVIDKTQHAIRACHFLLRHLAGHLVAMPLPVLMLFLTGYYGNPDEFLSSSGSIVESAFWAVLAIPLLVLVCSIPYLFGEIVRYSFSLPRWMCFPCVAIIHLVYSVALLVLSHVYVPDRMPEFFDLGMAFWHLFILMTIFTVLSLPYGVIVVLADWFLGNAVLWFENCLQSFFNRPCGTVRVIHKRAQPL